MHHALAVGLIEGVCYFDGVAKCVVEWESTFLQPFGQRLALDVLEDHEVDVFLIADLSAGALAKEDVVERADVRVIQTGDGPGLTLEPLLEVRVVG